MGSHSGQAHGNCFYILLNRSTRVQVGCSSGVKSFLKQYLSKSIVADGKTTRSKVESID